MDKDVEELLSRGVTEIIGKENLQKKLAAGEKLRIKLGIDPTSPNLHLGRSIPLLKLRDFQKLGHQAVLILGDFTTVIGDTSDKDSERPMMTREAVEENKKTYFEQAGKIIDLDKTELRYNSEWLEPLSYRELGEQADQFSVADFIARDNIKKRLDAGKRVSLREVLYPLMQGYDSVAVKANVELGGSDQRFNLLAGRTLQEKYGQEPQSIVMGPLIEGTDGRKMSSSWGNVITLTDNPEDMFGKIMSLRDELVSRYLELCTRIPLHEVEEIGKGHPKDAKMKLAFEITNMYHGAEAAKKAKDNFENAFSKGGVPEDVRTVKAGKDAELVDILIEEGVISSKSEFTRLNKEGAIREMENGVYRVGKHRFIRIERE
ncbi:tyrosine--tRNA ligase [Candidatus Parcubacteria bacterium]|nr:tyrosine--tRNA ligase [Candidatus Parcubacteria bacterium]